MIITREKLHDIKDYKLLPEGAPYQLIEGEFIMTPAPNPLHQIISANLFKKVSRFIDEKGIGITLYSPVDVYLGEKDAYQPDIVFINKERIGIIKEDGIYGAPDLIIEILSPSTAYYDIKKKYRVYERYDVKEYWIVDPDMRGVEVFLNDKGEFSLFLKVYEKGSIKSNLIKGLELSMDEVFNI
ncbi:MAG: Uma2 family endonuclease [Nitrospirae bacterium]|nr:Uma2 family endonuclease [Nitrospirota bacterium]